MNTSMTKGVVIGAVAAAAVAAGAVTGYGTMTAPKFAQVVAVKEVTRTASTPREECQDVQVQRQAPVKDENRIAGTVLGGLAGGLLGSTIGAGRGKTVATVAGAAAGGYAGNKVQQNLQRQDTVTSTERRCKTVTDKTQQRVGYDVTYSLDGRHDVVRMAYDPGPRIPLKDGKPDLTPPAPAK